MPGSAASVMTSLPSSPRRSGEQRNIALPPEDDPPPLFKTRRRWGVPEQPGTIPLEHDIDLTINPGEIIFDGRFRVIQKSNWTTDDLVKQSVEALDFAARDWGQPPGAFYWVPNIKLKTRPGGEAISKQFTKALTDFGASVKEQP